MRWTRLAALFVGGCFLVGMALGAHTRPAPAAPEAPCQIVGAGLPDPRCTPGASDPRVSDANLAQTVCLRGYSRTVRPPLSITAPLKREVMASYGLDGQDPADYELDHLWSIEDGGFPGAVLGDDGRWVLDHDRAVQNLWPQPYATGWNAHVKDQLENVVHDQLCAGELTVSQAGDALVDDWIASYQTLIAPRPEGQP